MFMWNPHESGDVTPELGSAGGTLPAIACIGAPPRGMTSPLPPSFMFGIYRVADADIDVPPCDDSVVEVEELLLEEERLS